MDDLEHMVFHLRVEHVFEKRLCQGRNRIFSFRLRIFPRRNVRKHLPDFLLHLFRVEVPYNHDSLKVRPVPSVVEIDNFFGLESVDDLKRPEDIAGGMFRSFVDEVILLVHHSGPGLVPASPFFTYDTSLGIEGGRLAGNVA